MSVTRAGWLATVFLAWCPAASIQIVPSSPTVPVGGTLTLTVRVDSITDLYAYQFDLSFTPGTISATVTNEAPWFAGCGSTVFIPGAFDLLNGLVTGVTSSRVGAVPGATGSGDLVSLEFLALVPAVVVTFELSNIILLDSNLTDIAFSNPTAATASITAVPEPGALGVVWGGLLILAAVRRSWETRVR